MKKVYVLGGGPAGISLCYELAKREDLEFILIEKDKMIGGLAKTVQWGDTKHDLGPHKIFSPDKKLMNKVKRLLPENSWLTREKKSSIFLKGHFLPYPPSPFSLIKVFGILKFLIFTFNYVVSVLIFQFKRDNSKSFEDDLLQRVGKGLYKALFSPIAYKLWGDPRTIDVKLSKSRVQTPNILEVLKGLFSKKKNSEFEALEFYYPKGGLQVIWNQMIQNLPRLTIHLQTSILEIKSDNNGVTCIKAQNSSGENILFDINQNDFIFSTIPLKSLAHLMSVEETIKQKIDNSIILNDLYLVFLKTSQANIFDDSWIFIPDAEIIFHRVSEQESFDPGMTKDCSVICCEVMSTDGKNIDAMSESELFDQVEKDLGKLGFNNLKIVDRKMTVLRKSYPVYKQGYQKSLDEIITYFDKYHNLKTIGRQGAFNYIGTLDAMDIGFGASEWFDKFCLSQESHHISWPKERKRTSYYPVLD